VIVLFNLTEQQIIQLSSSTRANISPSSTTNSSRQVCHNISFRASNESTQQDGKTPIHEHLEYTYLARTRAVTRILKGAGKYKHQEKSKKTINITTLMDSGSD